MNGTPTMTTEDGEVRIVSKFMSSGGHWVSVSDTGVEYVQVVNGSLLLERRVK
jgi:hypothetical protein